MAGHRENSSLQLLRCQQTQGCAPNEACFTCRQADGLESSARLVMILHGLTEDEDAATLAEELVFSRTNSDPPPPHAGMCDLRCTREQALDLCAPTAGAYLCIMSSSSPSLAQVLTP